MFEHILVAVDGSHKGGKSLPIAVDLATKYGSAVTVVHVREHGRYEGSEVDLGPATEAEELVGAVIEQFRAAGVEARSWSGPTSCRRCRSSRRPPSPTSS